MAETRTPKGSSPAFLPYWGKTASSPEGGFERHPLAYHCLDVAAVGEALMTAHHRLRRTVSDLLELPEDIVIRLVRLFLALHDIGKFAPAFQAKRPECFDGPAPQWGSMSSHVEAGRLLWDVTIAPRIADLAGGLTKLPKPISQWGRTVISHHGRPADLESLQNSSLRRTFRNEDIQAALTFTDTVSSLFESTPADLQLAATGMTLRSWARASWILAGLAILSDWLGSNRRRFPFHDGDDDLRSYWTLHARPAALRAVAAAGLLPCGSAAEMPFDALFHLPVPTPLQHLASTIELGQGPQLFVIEDLTGSGKTEAALMLAHRLLAADQADGFFVALPTMATANAMFDRVGAVYDRLFDAQTRPSLVLAHAGRDLSQRFQQSIEPENSPEDEGYGISEPATASQTCTAWLADHRKKALLAPAGVGTIDQALLGVLRVRHQSLRLLGTSGKVLVFDEVHACDTYMLGLLSTLLEHHAAARGSAIVLTATLPKSTRDTLCQAFQRGLGSPTESVHSNSFPALTHVRATGSTTIDVAPWKRQERRIRFQLVGDRADALDWACQQSGAGKCVAWICNTVADARGTFDALAVRLPPASLGLFHARLALGDRLDIEGRVVSQFGPASQPHERQGRVLVATQVIEQSLDLDFDELVTDLAPVDLLLQRAGRLRRHPRDAAGSPLQGSEARDERGLATLRVVSPSPSDDAGRNWYSRMFRGAGLVYPDHHRLWLTARELASRGEISLPHDCRPLLEGVYGEGAERRVPHGLSPAATETSGREAAERSYARANTISLESGYEDELGGWSDDEEHRTRLGEPTTTLRLARWDGHRLAPWATEHSNPWRMSEVNVRRSVVSGRSASGDPILEEAVYALEGAWRRSDTILLPSQRPVTESGEVVWSTPSGGTAWRCMTACEVSTCSPRREGRRRASVNLCSRPLDPDQAAGRLARHRRPMADDGGRRNRSGAGRLCFAATRLSTAHSYSLLIGLLQTTMPPNDDDAWASPSTAHPRRRNSVGTL